MDPSPLISLPPEMIMLIMVAVMSGSIGDYIRFRSCCKRLRGIATTPDIVHTLVPRHIMPRRMWALSGPFVQTYLDKRNTEALYRLGMLVFFRQHPRETTMGLAILREAARRNHPVAKFGVAMIVIFDAADNETRLDEGYDLLRSVVATRQTNDSRRTFIEGVRRLTDYARDTIPRPLRPRRRCNKHKLHLVNTNYEVRVYLTAPECIKCYCDAQVIRFWSQNSWERFPYQNPPR